MLNQAVILAGGLGSRLGELTKETPKPLLPVAGKPFLEYLVWNLARHGIKDILMSVGYHSAKISDHFGDGSRFGVRVKYVLEETPMGTGGGLKLCLDQLEDEFLVLNGDTLFDCDYQDLGRIYAEFGGWAAMALRRVNVSSRYGSVALDGVRVTGFEEKAGSGPGIVSGGVYVLRRPVLDRLPQGPSSLEQELFPSLAAGHLLAGALYDGFFIDIGIPESLHAAQTLVPEWRRKHSGAH